MKIVGDEVFIQRGETFSLDFEVKNERGDPYMIYKFWDNPYFVITITAARYEQVGDFRRTYWLDLSKRWVERQDGNMVEEDMKRFIVTEAYFLPLFSINEAIYHYGLENGGRIVLDPNSDYDITNYLFSVDEHNDGNKTYKYVKSYKTDGAGNVIDEEWVEYNFRVVKHFSTREMVEQTYLYDMKILAGESVQEHIARLLDMQGEIYDDLPWSDVDTLQYINKIVDEDERNRVIEIFESNVPLMPEYDTKLLILMPTALHVSANIQGGLML